MKVKILQSVFSKQLEQVWALQWGHFALFAFMEFFNLYHGLLSGWGILGVVIALALYGHFFRALRELSYSYWTFASCYGLFFAYRFLMFLFSPDFLWNHLFYLLALAILGWQAWQLFRPIFYPKVSWWEYDFRYRDDVKVFFHGRLTPELREEGRLIDWQKTEACLVAFGDFPLGEELMVEIAYGNQAPLVVQATIYSQRHALPGRGFLYGIGLSFSEAALAQQFLQFTQDWAHNSILKKKRKYSDWRAQKE